jgi:hypothetical protein
MKRLQELMFAKTLNQRSSRAISVAAVRTTREEEREEGEYEPNTPEKSLVSETQKSLPNGKDSEESQSGNSSDAADEWSSSEAEGQPEQGAEVKVDRERRDREDDRKISPSRPIYSKERHQPKKGHSMAIEQELQESFIRAVQNGQDDDEWNRFCLAEKQRLIKESNKWSKWKRQRDESSEDETEESPDDHESDLPENPDRVVTPEPAQRPRAKKLKQRKPERQMRLEVGKRSQ